MGSKLVLSIWFSYQTSVNFVARSWTEPCLARHGMRGGRAQRKLTLKISEKATASLWEEAIGLFDSIQPLSSSALEIRSV